MGWIKLDRKILDNGLWTDKEPFDKRSAWVDLLLLANHKNVKAVDGEQFVEYERGTVVTSISYLADRWKWSRGKVRRFLELLESDSMINQKRTDKRTAINIVNYCVYQDARTEERTGDGQVTDTPRTHNKKEEKVKKEKNIINNYAEENNARAREHDGAAVISFPLEDGTEYEIAEQEFEELVSRYPMLNVMAELVVIKGWCQDNPDKRKTRRGAKGFITNWLNKAKRDHDVAETTAKTLAAANSAMKTQSRGATFFDLLTEDAV